jgi:hypothetical protein
VYLAAAGQPKPAPTVSISPNPGGLPGTEVLQGILNGLAFWGLLATVAGVLIGAIVWALGSHSNNHQWSSRGRSGALISAGSALVVGGAAPLVNFFIDLGGKIQ